MPSCEHKWKKYQDQKVLVGNNYDILTIKDKRKCTECKLIQELSSDTQRIDRGVDFGTRP